MALLTLNECAEQTTARSGRDASYSRRFVLNYDAAVDEKTAREETGIPRVGYVHPRSNYSVVTDVTADPIDGNRRQAWMVVCVYQSRRGGVASSVTKNEPGQLYDNPLERKPRVRFGTSLYSMPISQAYGNNNRLEVDIKNSAGDPFDPPPQADRHHGTFVYMRNEAMYDPTLAERYVNTCNSVDWLYWSKGKVRCDGIEAEFLFESGVQYYAVTYQFAIHPETWRLRLMDAGMRCNLNDSDDNPQYCPCTDMSGIPVSSPVFLDGDGYQLARGATPVEIPSTHINGLPGYVIYREYDFAALNIVLP